MKIPFFKSHVQIDFMEVFYEFFIYRDSTGQSEDGCRPNLASLQFMATSPT